ncbi:MAG: glycosyltransferase [Candidatus Peribacteria bacterium]|jgi:GT2 family glycosyltransferase|nr:glycosyltransferase [Candidatus Peribacteria bacterium]
MRLSVVFGTRGTELQHLERIFHCLAKQTFPDFTVIVVVDNPSPPQLLNHPSLIPQYLKKNVRIFTADNSDFRPHSPGKASYVRNFGIQQADTELIQLFDEDNAFDETYLQQAIQHYDEMKKQMKTEVVICSTLKWRDTDIIQNQGFSRFWYGQSRPKVNRLGNKAFGEIQMFSGNGVLGSAQLFKAVGYDEQIARIAEDLDFTLSLHETGAKLWVYADLVVRHYERDKSRLEQARIGFPEQARQKARNRFLFVWKHGNVWQKTAFWVIGLP